MNRFSFLFALAFALAGLLGCGPTAEPPLPPPPLAPAAPPWLAAANDALARSAFATGLALADSAVAHAPGAPAPYFVRGRLYFELGRMDDARAAYRRVLALDPTYEGAWHNLGNVAFRQRRYREALGYYREEATLHPSPNPWHGLGGTFEALGLADSARVAYERAVTLDAAYAPAHAALADWYEREGDFAAALAHARDALAHTPEDPAMQYRVGALLFRTGAYADAAERLAPVVAAEPWNYSAWFTLGQARQRLGHPEAAATLAHADAVRAEQATVERLRREARTAPEHFAAQIALADALRRSGRRAEALATYHLALALRPDHLALQNNLATLYLQQDDTTEALARYRDILRQDSTFAEAWLNLGLHYARTGHRPAAEAAWRKAFAYGADNPAVQAFRTQLQRGKE